MSEYTNQKFELDQRQIDDEFCRMIAAERALETLDEIEGAEYQRPEYMPVGLDPLSSARSYNMTALVHGENSPEAKNAFDVLRSDVRTALFEALIERGHISVTKSEWNEDEQGFHMGGLLYRDLLERSFDDRLILAEYERRLVELHEELFIEELHRSGLLEGKVLLTISPFPDDMSAQWARELGYKEKTRKYMIRWVEVEDGVRTTKQLSMSGSDTRVLSGFLRMYGYLDGPDLTATEILNSPILLEKDQFADIAQVASSIDAIAGQDVFLGGAPNGDSYDTLESVSQEREERLLSSIDGMVYDLLKAEQAISSGSLAPEKAMREYARILLKTRNAICVVDPEMVRESVGEKAYNNFRKAHQMILDGKNDIDIDLCLREAEREAEAVYVCGLSTEQNQQGNGPEGSGENCNEIKNGQIGQCPGCKHVVSIIVEGVNKDRLYCPRAVCKLSKVGGKNEPKVEKEVEEEVNTEYAVAV